MTEPTLELCDLARQLVEHPRWKWEPGVVTTHHVDGYSSKLVGSPGVVDFGGCHVVRQLHGKTWWVTPDIEHPATKGWLLHMLREELHSADMCTGFFDDSWSVILGPSGYYPTEGQALAAALLHVWGAHD